jgi:hypothetical protein
MNLITPANIIFRKGLLRYSRGKPGKGKPGKGKPGRGKPGKQS